MKDIQKAQTNGETFNVPIDGEGSNVESVTGALTLTGADSGKVFILNAATGAAISLPAVTMTGFKAKFITGLAFATTNWTVVSATSVIQGSVIVNSTHVAGSNENTISFVASAESLGDWAEVVSDGTNWYVNGSGVTSGSITLTAA